MTNHLDLAGPVPRGRILLEASAGTGKTYALTALIVRSIAEGLIAVDSVLVVTFTRSAAGEIRDRIRAGIDEAAAAIRESPAEVDDWLVPLLAGGDAARAERHDRLRSAAVDLDAAVVTTIHGFCRQALIQMGSQGGLPRDAAVSETESNAHRQVVRDLLVAALIREPGLLDPDGDETNPGRIEDQISKVVERALQNRGASVVPDPGWPTGDDLPTCAIDWAELARKAVTEVVHRRVATGRLDHDDLLTILHDALHDPVTGPANARSLRTRFPMVFIDEFQDTDTVQWEIFERAFLADPDDLGPPSDLYVVGDPKQAIYRFRGADIEAYLRASAGVDTRFDLTVNRRSDGELVEVLNELCRGATFGDARIRYVEADRSPDAPPNATGLPAVSIRWMPPHPGLLSGNSVRFVDGDRSKMVVLEDLADEVTRLLSGTTMTVGGKVSPVEPGHIAVIVRAHADADAVVATLTGRGIPAVQTRVGSVFESTMAEHLRLLLHGLRRPSDPHLARAVGLSCLVGYSPSYLQDDDVVAGLQERLAGWSDLMVRTGVHGLIQALRADPAVLDALVQGGDGARLLTDLDHLAELLHTACEGRTAAPATVLRLLDGFIVDARDTEVAGDEVRRRIASDAAAVQVTTVHGSKGLQFPIVLVPFSAKGRSGTAPHVYRVDDRRYVDAAPRHPWTIGNPDHDLRKEAAGRAADGDEQRLLYVALTRAMHRLVVWWRPTKGVGAAGLSRLLFGDRDDQGAVDTSEDVSPLPTEDQQRHSMAGLVNATGGLLEVLELPPRPAPLAPTEPALPLPPPGPPATVDTGGFADPDWRTWSFSSVTDDRRVEDPAPPAGGVDEPPMGTERPVVGSSGLADMPAGRQVGLLIHDMLEKADFTSADLADDLRGALGGSSLFDPVDHGPIAEGLITALGTPLAPLTGTRLVEVGRSDRLDELRFDLRLADTHTRVRMADVCRIVAETSEAGAHATYFMDLAKRIGTLRPAGYLGGSIDAVLRVHDDDGPRFLVVDYKSNRLHRPGDSLWLDRYRPEGLLEAMEEHDYPLQAFLYTVALHRYLRWRLGSAYDPSTHLGGSAYLFLRGMVGELDGDGRAFGVSTWVPPLEAVHAADRILAGGR